MPISSIICHSKRICRHGIDGLKSMIQLVRLGFSDFHIDVEDMIAKDDRVVTRFLVKGNDDGPVFRSPSFAPAGAD